MVAQNKHIALLGRTSTRSDKGSWENLHQNHQGITLRTLARTHQPNQQHTSDSEVARQQQKRARNSPERNPHQDNNKRFLGNLTRTQGNQAMHLSLEGNATATRNEHNT
ncbi:hypothetical protein Taro_033471, partial [Colocasia esculenta]|nr:hypothetical protein [Colocasia esculenta]